jgi:hypothetical protein
MSSFAVTHGTAMSLSTTYIQASEQTGLANLVTRDKISIAPAGCNFSSDPCGGFAMS